MLSLVLNSAPGCLETTMLDIRLQVEELWRWMELVRWRLAGRLIQLVTRHSIGVVVVWRSRGYIAKRMIRSRDKMLTGLTWYTRRPP